MSLLNPRAVLVRSLALLAALVLVSGPLLVPGSAPSATAASGQPGGGWTQTKTLERDFANDSGSAVPVDTRRVSVKVDETRELQGRERVHVSWSGAHPSAARASNPFGEGGLNQEYPVVIMQCRGLDDPTLPAAKRLSPQTCWTSTRMQRSQTGNQGDAIWTRDLYATAADQSVKGGMEPYPAKVCQDSDPSSYVHLTPFSSAGGQQYAGCTAETMPPEASVGASFPAAEQAAFTGLDGSGETDFEVRSSVENESLGCSHTVACSLVVIPIMGLSCARKDPGHAPEDRNCRRAGQHLPGSSNFANDGVDATVSPLYWWSGSNWRNRYSVPLTFGLPAGACDVLDPRAPTAFYGSELLSQAALQWAPAYCLRKDRFKWQENSMPDDAAFALMQQGEAAAATVSGPRESGGTDPVAYAPTAVTGFAVSYVVDRPDNAGEYERLRLNPRLLAKLLTQSYTASGLGEGHPGLGKNPRSLNTDPEFQKLNPGLSALPSEAAATVMSLSTSSDVISTLTTYIDHDADARAFLAGRADPWGMRVNPSYKGLALPVAQWPILDTYVPPSPLECLKQNPSPYLPRVAAPVSSLRQIASAVLDSWPLVQTKCDRSLPTDPWKLGRIDRQGTGSRFLLGITTLGDARRFGLRAAALQTRPGAYVAPDNASMASAVALARPGRPLAPFTIDQAAVARSSTAYPGTMVVYTAARTHGLRAVDAAKVAQFVTVSTTEGQVPGRGNGNLAAGYLPITRTGVTAKLFASAQRAAKAVREQRAPATSASGGGSGSGSGDGGGGGAGGGGGVSAGAGTAGGSVAGGDAGTAGSPAAGGPLSAGPVLTKGTTLKTAPGAAAPAVITARTRPVSSRVGGVFLQLLVGLAFVGGGLGVAGRLMLRARGVR